MRDNRRLALARRVARSKARPDLSNLSAAATSDRGCSAWQMRLPFDEFAKASSARWQSIIYLYVLSMLQLLLAGRLWQRNAFSSTGNNLIDQRCTVE
jgi:hypothetical protein